MLPIRTRACLRGRGGVSTTQQTLVMRARPKYGKISLIPFGLAKSNKQTLARMAYLENHTSVLLGVFFIVTGVKNWVEHINVRILGLKSVPLRILFPIFCYVHSVKQCWQKHTPPKRGSGGDTLLSFKIAYPDWNVQAHLIKLKLDQTDQYFLNYGWFSWKKAKKAQRCSIGNCSKVFLGTRILA